MSESQGVPLGGGRAGARARGAAQRRSRLLSLVPGRRREELEQRGDVLAELRAQQRRLARVHQRQQRLALHARVLRQRGSEQRQQRRANGGVAEEEPPHREVHDLLDGGADALEQRRGGRAGQLLEPHPSAQADERRQQAISNRHRLARGNARPSQGAQQLGGRACGARCRLVVEGVEGRLQRRDGRRQHLARRLQDGREAVVGLRELSQGGEG